MHLQTLGAIAKLFTNRTIRERLATAENHSEVLCILENKPSRIRAGDPRARQPVTES
jgi:mannitol/fructose-specific phosphotransferase system IIA component (Ntr-type)